MNLKLSARRIEWVVRAACVGSLAALGLIVWSQLDPSPIAVIVAMSVGQAIGTASLGLFVLAIVSDLRRAHVLDTAAERSAARAAGETPPASLPSPPVTASDAPGPSEAAPPETEASEDEPRG